jgi:hypothetical protein
VISLTPGFSRVRTEERTASRFSGFRLSSKPLKRFVVLSVGCTWLKPGVNEKSLAIHTKAN